MDDEPAVDAVSAQRRREIIDALRPGLRHQIVNALRVAGRVDSWV